MISEIEYEWPRQIVKDKCIQVTYNQLSDFKNTKYFIY